MKTVLPDRYLVLPDRNLAQDIDLEKWLISYRNTFRVRRREEINCNHSLKTLASGTDMFAVHPFERLSLRCLRQYRTGAGNWTVIFSLSFSNICLVLLVLLFRRILFDMSAMSLSNSPFSLKSEYDESLFAASPSILKFCFLSCMALLWCCRLAGMFYGQNFRRKCVCRDLCSSSKTFKIKACLPPKTCFSRVIQNRYTYAFDILLDVLDHVTEMILEFA
jgi:hypothetical protein